MSRPRFAERALVVVTLAVLPACSVFEPPLAEVEDDGSVDPVTGKDGGDGEDPERDASSDDHDAGPIDAGEQTEDAGEPEDAGEEDASVMDASVEPPEMIPTRPGTLVPCGFAMPASSASINAAALEEISGIAASRKHANVLWVLEDSGNGPAVHAVSVAGVLLGTYRVSGSAVDYEDIALGPGPDPNKDYLYVGDIGDNSGNRENVTVYRAPEPTVSATQMPVSEALTGVEPLPMKYPIGATNAEALFVDPALGDVYVVTKDGFSRPNTVYRLSAPHQPTVVRELERVGPVFAGLGSDISITAADMSADGKHIMIRSLRSVSHWTRAAGASIADTILNTLPCDGLLGAESKGESIAVTNDGYYTVSEGLAQPIYYAPYVTR